MAIKGRKGGVRLRHVLGSNLLDLQDGLEALHYKVTVLDINRVGNNWYIHFILPEVVEDRQTVRNEVAMKTLTTKVRRK